MTRDDRIPVVVGEAVQAQPGDRVLRASDMAPRPGHIAGCACCRPRDGLALALARLFFDRARDPAENFSRVLVVLPDAEAVAQSIEGDVLARARYRFAGRA